MNATNTLRLYGTGIVLLILAIILVWLSSSLRADQTYAAPAVDNEGWSLFLEGEENLGVSDIAAASDDGILVFGSSAGDYSFIAQVRSDGTMGWQKQIDYWSGFSASPTGDGGYLLTGHGGLLMKVDGQGKIVWQKKYGGDNTNFSDIVETADGSILVVGGINSSTFALKLSSNGDVIWQRNWNKTGWDGFQSIVLAADDHYLLFGNLGPDSWIVKLKSDGTPVWQKKLSPRNPAGVIEQAISADGASSLIYIYDNGEPWLAQVLSDGTLGWQKKYSWPDGPLQFNDMLALPNGYTLLLGLRERSDMDDHAIDGIALEIDSTGNPLWQRVYRAGGQYDVLLKAAIDNDGFVYGAGYSEQDIYEPQNEAWIIKLANQGQIARCPPVSALEVQTETTAYTLSDLSEPGSTGTMNSHTVNLESSSLDLDTIKICPLPHLSIAKSGPQKSLGGNPFTYALTVTNNTDEALTGIEIRDRLPAGATYVSGGRLEDGEVIWDVGRLEGGAQASKKLTISARQKVTNAEYSVSCAEGYSTKGDTLVETRIENLLQLPVVSANYCPDYLDDFSDKSSGWPIVDNAQWSTRYIGGKYELRTKVPGGLAILSPACSRRYYVLEADMQWESAPGSGLGLMFDVSSDGASFSVLTLDTVEKTMQYQKIEHGSVSSTEMDAPSIKTGRAKNHLRIIRTNDEVLVEINGTPAETLNVDAVLEKTRVGLSSMSTGAAPSTAARFDNFIFISWDGE